MLKQEPCRITVCINRVKNKFQICITFAIYFSHCLTHKQYYLDVLFATTVDKVYVSMLASGFGLILYLEAMF